MTVDLATVGTCSISMDSCPYSQLFWQLQTLIRAAKLRWTTTESIVVVACRGPLRITFYRSLSAKTIRTRLATQCEALDLIVESAQSLNHTQIRDSDSCLLRGQLLLEEMSPKANLSVNKRPNPFRSKSMTSFSIPAMSALKLLIVNLGSKGYKKVSSRTGLCLKPCIQTLEANPQDKPLSTIQWTTRYNTRHNIEVSSGDYLITPIQKMCIEGVAEVRCRTCRKTIQKSANNLYVCALKQQGKPCELLKSPAGLKQHNQKDFLCFDCLEIELTTVYECSNDVQGEERVEVYE